jgi:membrane fusion protein, multidrug efflux system
MNLIKSGALALLLSVALLTACSRPETRSEPVRVVRSTLVASTAASGSQSYAAEIRARSEVRLGFRVGGKLASRQAEVGQRVKAGQVLARLDPEDLRLSQDAARAAVRTAEVNADLMQADFKRYKELRDLGFISGAELERREANLKSAAAQLAQARAQAAVQSNQAAYTALVATHSGVVIGVEAEPGAVLAAGSPVVRVAVDGPRDAVFAVPEDAASAMRALLGKRDVIGVNLWAGSEALRATVREVAAVADPVTRTFLVKADLTAAQLQLGQTATVRIDLPQTAGLMVLPLTAIKEHDGRSSVWVVEGDPPTVRNRLVDVAGAQGNDMVIASGLKLGERVVTAGVHVLTEGQKVRLMSAGAPSVAAASAAAR